jgi:hypothetical protein
MIKKLSYSGMLLAWSAAPAFAGDGASGDGVGTLVVQLLKLVGIL